MAKMKEDTSSDGPIDNYYQLWGFLELYSVLSSWFIGSVFTAYKYLGSDRLSLSSISASCEKQLSGKQQTDS